MRELRKEELSLVAGGDGTAGTCGVVPDDTANIGGALIDAYEGAVEVTSHIIERVAEAL